MMGFPFVPMEVVERSQYDGGTYFLIQTVADRNGWEVAEVRTDIPWQLKTAQLLSTAPELLEALERIACAAECTVVNKEWIARHARAAIAKAKGEQQ